MSKGLEALKYLNDHNLNWHDNPTKKCVDIIEKELRALEVVKEKGKFFSLEYDEYNDKYYIYDNELYMRNEITKEEYELLKEMFS